MKKVIISFCYIIILGVVVHAVIKQLIGYSEAEKIILEYLITIPAMIIIFIKSFEDNS
jgi:hypothetical protein